MQKKTVRHSVLVCICVYLVGLHLIKFAVYNVLCIYNVDGWLVRLISL